MAVTAGTGGRLSALPDASSARGFASDIGRIELAQDQVARQERKDIVEGVSGGFKQLADYQQEQKNQEQRKALYDLQMQKAQVDYQEALRKQNLANLEDVYKQREGVKTQAIAEVFTTTSDPEFRNKLLADMGATDEDIFKAQQALQVYGGDVTRVNPSEVYTTTSRRLQGLREAEQAELEKQKLKTDIASKQAGTQATLQDIAEGEQKIEESKFKMQSEKAKQTEKQNEVNFFNALNSVQGEITEEKAKELSSQFERKFTAEQLEAARAGGATSFEDIQRSVEFISKLKENKATEGETVFEKLKANWGIKNPGVLSGEFTSEEINQIAQSNDPEIAKKTQQIALLSDRELMGKKEDKSLRDIIDEGDTGSGSALIALLGNEDKSLPIGDAAKNKIKQLKAEISEKLSLGTSSTQPKLIDKNGDKVLDTRKNIDLTQL